MSFILNSISAAVCVVYASSPMKTSTPNVRRVRLSEFLALKWSDVDLKRGQLYVRRAIVYGRFGGCKTAASRKPLPLDPFLIEVLQGHRARSP